MTEPQQCLGRYTTNKQRRKFPLKGDYFLEMRCPNILKDPSNDICESCYDKLKKEELGVKTTNMTRFHGRIYEPLSKDNSCWLYDAERFWKFANLPGNKPSQDDLQEAVVAQRIARNTVEMKNTIVPLAPPAPAPAPANSEKKLATKSKQTDPVPEEKVKVKRKYTKKITAPPAPTPTPTQVVEPINEVKEVKEVKEVNEVKEVKEEKVKKQKKVIKKATSIPQPLPIQEKPKSIKAIAIESISEPIQPEDILEIPVRSIEIHDILYWIDGKKDKLYKRDTKGSIGAYVGRYRREADSIDRDFPDSDVE